MASVFVAIATSLAVTAALPAAQPAPAAQLSVLSYNVHGLPWPLTTGRPKALRAIRDRLTAMRAKGDQPHLVLLQEAFSGDAKAIARTTGYKYVVNGPSRDDRVAEPADSRTQQFARADRKLAHYSRRRQVEVDRDRQRFPIEVIDDIERAEARTIPQRIAHKVC